MGTESDGKLTMPGSRTPQVRGGVRSRWKTKQKHMAVLQNTNKTTWQNKTKTTPHVRTQEKQTENREHRQR